MSPRYAARADDTQKPIVSALREVGAKVLHIREPFDILVHYRGKLYMMDCKTPKSKAGAIRKKPSQLKLEAEGWPVLYPRSPEEAVRMIGVNIR